MAGDSEWDVLQVRLTQLRQAVAAEIRAYPAPIPACDAQYSHLLERRTALAAALQQLFDDVSTRRRLASAGRDKVLRDFNLHDSVAALARRFGATAVG